MRVYKLMGIDRDHGQTKEETFYRNFKTATRGIKLRCKEKVYFTEENIEDLQNAFDFFDGGKESFEDYFDGRKGIYVGKGNGNWYWLIEVNVL